MTTKYCAHCGQPFEPRPQVPDQAFCSTPGCQRARKRQWQRSKLQSDPDYRANQQVAQQAWAQRNQDYWRNYRAIGPDDGEWNRKRQHRPGTSPQEQGTGLAKMDVSTLPSGIYRITKHPAFPMGAGDSCVVEITLLSPTCPCKMDASREDLIDTPAIRP